MVAVTACCFCKRPLDQVTHLIQGPELFIYDICVDACIDTAATKDPGWRERQIDYLVRLRHGRSQPDQPPGRPCAYFLMRVRTRARAATRAPIESATEPTT